MTKVTNHIDTTILDIRTCGKRIPDIITANSDISLLSLPPALDKRPPGMRYHVLRRIAAQLHHVMLDYASSQRKIGRLTSLIFFYVDIILGDVFHHKFFRFGFHLLPVLKSR